MAHAMADDCAEEYKFILLGDSGVGKSTFFHRIRTGEFLSETMMGRRKRPEERHVHRGKVDGRDVKVTLYDTCGEEHYRTFTSQFYRKTDAVILMYSVEDTNTFDNLHRWVSDAKQSINNEDVVWVLVGNKSDLPLYVEHCEIERLRRQLNTPLSFFTCAKTGERVQTTFIKAISEVHRKAMERPSQRVRQDNGGDSIFLLAPHREELPDANKPLKPQQASCCS